jgi:hypothetical protein
MQTEINLQSMDQQMENHTSEFRLHFNFKLEVTTTITTPINLMEDPLEEQSCGRNKTTQM